jgi:Helix-turn-helix domain
MGRSSSPVVQGRASPGVVVVGQGYLERVPVRYRYRLYPTPGQRQALARVFGHGEEVAK